MNSISIDINPSAKIRRESVGQEQQPVVLVDNFLADPHALVALARQQANLQPYEDMYPGVRSHLPPGYLQLLESALGKLIYTTFNLTPASISSAQAYFSIVTTPPAQLRPYQRLPHMDGTHPSDMAFMHYLCSDRFGGTSFYRHRGTGYEYVDRTRYPFYREMLEQELQKHGLPEPPQYMNGDSVLFERVASIQPRFNRLVIYRGNSLHSGDIGHDYTFDPSPETGRLTVTSFLRGAG